jgi:hypothetical protein
VCDANTDCWISGEFVVKDGDRRLTKVIEVKRLTYCALTAGVAHRRGQR